MAGVVIAKVVLVLLNVFIGLLALIFIVVGSALEYGKALFDSFVVPILDQLLASTGNSGMSFTISEQDWQTIMSTIHMVAIPLMIAGVILFAVTFCACCGICCSNKTLLLVYAVAISTLTLVFVIGGIWVYVKKEELLLDYEPMLQQWIANDYVNETSTDVCSIVINILNIFGECCGIVNYTDFDDYPKTVTTTINGFTVPGVQVVPATCCKGVTIDSPVPSDLTCTTAPTTLNTNMNKGCYQDFLLAYLDSYSDYVAYGGLAFLIGMAVITLFAWMVCCSLNKSRKRVTYA